MINPEKKPPSPSFEKKQSEENEDQKLKPWHMIFEQFNNEYQKVMKAVAEKEKKGELDPNKQPYTPISEKEQVLLETDWREFSRQRGFDEDDIREYARWLELSGQEYNLPNAVNDPWRRTHHNWEITLYLSLIEYAQQQGFNVPPQILNEANNLKEKLQRKHQPRNDSSSQALPSPEDTEPHDDIW